MIIKANIERLIRRGVKLGLIRLDEVLPDSSQGKFGSLLQRIAELLERLQHGATMRRMMYEYAEISQAPLVKQLESHKQSLEKAGERPSHFDEAQFRGLGRLKSAYDAMKEELEGEDPSTIDRQQDDIHNPNVLVDCGSGTDGELGCSKPDHVKVYQTVFSASYGESNYKDVFQQDVHARSQLVIHPAGGKCNVSIGNPFRMVGWYFNYTIQGSRAALIRMWEIPATYFERLLSYAGTEAQIKDMKSFYKKQKRKNDKFHVELCDHRATNQFGLWTHEEDGTPNEFGKEFMKMSSRLVTYYNPKGKHRPVKRDGECRDIKRLLEHLGIPTDVHDRYHNLGTSLSDAEGNLTMNEEASKQDLKLLGIIELLSDSSQGASSKLDSLDKDRVRTFCNILLYNGMSPQRFNKKEQYTSTGLSVKNLRIESQFMAEVHRSRSWHTSLRKVLGILEQNLRTQNLAMPPDCVQSIATLFPPCTTYQAALGAARGLLGSGDIARTNATFIEGLNILLRFLCSGGGGFKDSFKPVSTKSEAKGPESFRFRPLQDLRFEIGASHRASANGMAHQVDSLDGHKRPGFTYSDEFSERLDPSTLTSNTRFQLFQHEQVISRLQDAGLPVMGGISGTTRDIFRYFGSELLGPGFWDFFAVVAAFMIKNHFHSLAECFIAAVQFYDRDGTLPPTYHFSKLDAEKLYNTICIRTRLDYID
jgi:hypothetical protein